MESVLQGIPRVVVYIDDILVTGRDEQEHLATLEEVLQRLEEVGLQLQKNKCHFMVPSMTYLGYQIDAEDLHPVKEKVEAIQKVPEPHNVSELKLYLGLLSYYSRFLPNLSSTPAPLYQHLQQNVPWRWTSKERQAFQFSKQLLLSSQVLAHFDPEMEMRMMLRHMELEPYFRTDSLNRTEKPIGFVSRTLTDAEMKYSQVEKEELACVFRVTRFNSYLYGHHFSLITDHKSLLSLFDASKPVPPQASG